MLPLGRPMTSAATPLFQQMPSATLHPCRKAGSTGDALYRAKITLSTGELFAWTFVIILLSAGFEKLFLLALDKAVGTVLGEEGTKC